MTPDASRKLTLTLALTCAVQAGAITAILVGPADPTTTPATPDPSNATAIDIQTSLRDVEARVAELNAKLNQVVMSTSAANARHPVEPQQGPAPEVATAVDRLERLTERLVEIARSLPITDPIMQDVADQSRRHPVLNIENLTRLCEELDGTRDSPIARGWMFRTAAEVVATFGLPTRNNSGYWWYYFPASGGREGYAGFNIVNGLVAECSGGFKAPR